jgi:hypothetical protein
MAACSRCAKPIPDGEAPPLLCAACAEAGAGPAGDASGTPPEFDHRGIRLPARTRVGGIIIPQ